MRFESDWRNDLDFDSYIEELRNESSIERTWLQPILKHELNNTEKGIFCNCRYGIWKVFDSFKLLCAQKNSVWYDMRSSVLAYHICRHDTSSTKPGVFIKNLVGQVVTHIPELGNSILSDDGALDFLLSGRCREAPIACVEFSFLSLLKQLWGNRTYIIVIDAVDECLTPDLFNMVEFLQRKIPFFPQTIKFILTSRNSNQIVERFEMLKISDLTKYKDENLQDIRRYIMERIDLDRNDIIRLIDRSDGNFLQVKLFINHCIKTNSCMYEHVPYTLEQVYLLNLQKKFGTKKVSVMSCMTSLLLSVPLLILYLKTQYSK